jgi:hypothetical protein
MDQAPGRNVAIVALVPALRQAATPLREIVLGLLIGPLKRYLDLWPFPH